MIESFFDDEVVNIIRGDEKKKSRVHQDPFANVGCNDCGLFKSCQSPKMAPSGQGKLPILFVGEAPGKTEDLCNKQFVGQSGILLRETLVDLGYKLDRDFFKTNALNCRPPNNAEPTPLQIAACRKRLLADIKSLKPKIVVALGKSAMMALVGNRLSSRMTDLSTTDWAGELIPDQDLGVWIVPTYHPAYLLRNERDKVLKKQFTAHIKSALDLLSTPLPIYPYKNLVKALDAPEAVKLLKKFIANKTKTAYDYETTGLKPHRKGHAVVTIGVSDGKSWWGFNGENEVVKKAWAEFLASDCPKIAHNAKFEMIWGHEKFGVWTANIIWDTMLAAHAKHNKKATNLKFHAYANFGVIGYDDKADPYLEPESAESEKYGGNAFNAIRELDEADLIEYNGLDAYWTFLLYEKQLLELNSNQIKGVQFLTNASYQIAWAEQNGLALDTKNAPLIQQDLSDKMKAMEKTIAAAPELKKWDLRKRGRPFRPGTPADLTHVLFDLMKLKPTAFTAGGADGSTKKPSADKAAMEPFEHIELVSNTMQWRKWQKMRDTYIKGFLRETVDGVMHPSFNLGSVDTFRSSSSNPNFQNVPKRDKESAAPIRRLLVPKNGRLVEYDYKAVEVCVSTCVHKDPNMIRYVEDPKSDMHRDTGMELFIKTQQELTSDDRSVAKNGFVFPEFYGSYFEQIAPDIWFKVSDETKQHLKSKGILNVRDFTAHVQDIEERFWSERFPVYADWKQKTWRTYQKTGYVELHTGFRCYGPMSFNQVTNYPVQGPAFHCLLWTFTEVSKMMRAKKTKSHLIGQIHDAAVGDVDPSEEDMVDYWMWDFGTQKIREYWDWIIVPLSIEKGRSEIWGNWSKMENCGLLKGTEFH